MSSLEKSLLACGLFVVFGAIAWRAEGTTAILPLIAYYCVLVLNTFFSINAISAITPNNVWQNFFDGALVCIYALLAFSFFSVPLFTAVSSLLFVFSFGKYVHLDRIVNYRLFLRRKMRINALGFILSLTAFGIALSGYATAAAWLLFITFAIANIYLLAIKPMYRLEN